MEDKPKTKYEELAAIDVGPKIEKKNGLSYLSWAWALDTLFRADPDATWEYLEPKMYGETMMVYCTVVAFSKPRTAHLPVMNYKNQPIPNPNAFEVNTAMQRVLVKAIAMHGLGLYIYAGEDLPPGSEKEEEIKSPPARKSHSASDGAFDGLDNEEKSKVMIAYGSVIDLWAAGKEIAAYEQVYENDLSNDQKIAIYELLRDQSAIRNALKKMRAAALPPEKPGVKKHGVALST